VRLPRWFPREGRPLHAAVGLGFTLVMLVVALAGGEAGHWFAPTMNFCGVLALAVAHEQAPRDDGTTWYDFRTDFWNGGLDVLSFLPAPAVWLLLWLGLV
jgi:hypothetical protein